MDPDITPPTPLDSSNNETPVVMDPHSDPVSDPNEFSDESDDALSLSDSHDSLEGAFDNVTKPLDNTETEGKKTLVPGITAASVMAGLLRSIKMGYEKCFTQAEAQLIEHFIATAQQEFPIFSMNGMLMRTVSALPLSWQARFFNTAVIPAYDHYLLARKLMVRRIIEQKISEGVLNVVIIGAGFETASLFASADFPEVMFYDVEQEPTYSTRVKALDTLPQAVIDSAQLGAEISTANNEKAGSYAINHNYKLIRGDLNREMLDALLLRHGFETGKKTLVIIEAMLMYLKENDVKGLFRDLTDLNTTMSDDILYVYASFLDKNKLSVVSSSAQSNSKELIQSVLPPEAVLGFMDVCNFKVEGQFEPVSQLDRVHDMENFEFYQKDKTRPREQFYLMSSSGGVLKPNQDKTMADIPVLPLEINPALLPEIPAATKPDCSVM